MPTRKQRIAKNNLAGQLERLEPRRTMDAGRFSIVSNAIGTASVDHYDQVVAGDFNGDGRDDLFMMIHSTGENRLIFSRASQKFSVVTNRLTKTVVDGYTQVVAGDFNGDGRDDLFFLDRDSGANRFAFAKSNESFSTSTNLISPGSADDYSHWAAGDVDHDGRDDLFFVDRTSGANRIAYARANNKFSIQTDALSRSAVDGYSNAVFGDFDKDGRDDLYLWDSATGSNRLAYARSHQKFSVVTNPIAVDSLSGFDEVKVFDFDGTGRADLFFWNRTTGSNVLATMSSSLHFSLATNRLKAPIATGFTELVGGNFDGDSRDDLFFVDATSGSNRFGYSRKSFDIQVIFKSTYTESQQAMIRAAAARWSEIVVGDLPNVSDPEYGTIDDLLIEVTTAAIDGSNNVLANTEILVARNSDLPALARVRIDSSDLASLTAGGDLTGIMVHEMGHALGMEAQTWLNLGLLSNSGGPYPVFTGTNASREYRAVFGTLGGQFVAVENVGGAASRNNHWRENVMGKEIMTSQYSLGELNPISRITIGALQDLGYAVDYSSADVYSG